jgi:hypothetical protein
VESIGSFKIINFTKFQALKLRTKYISILSSISRLKSTDTNTHTQRQLPPITSTLAQEPIQDDIQRDGQVGKEGNNLLEFLSTFVYLFGEGRPLNSGWDRFTHSSIHLLFIPSRIAPLPHHLIAPLPITPILPKSGIMSTARRVHSHRDGQSSFSPPSDDRPTLTSLQSHHQVNSKDP